MRYFFVSDIHSNYTKLVEALNEKKFNRFRDTLVVLGDFFDKGKESLKVLFFINSLPNKILIWGNHDYMLYLLVNNLVKYTPEEILNGSANYFEQKINTKANTYKIMNLKQKYLTVLNNLFKQFHNAIEFKNLNIIASHAWLPDNWKNNKTNFLSISKEYLKNNFYFYDILKKDTKTIPSEYKWYRASWEEPLEHIKKGEYIKNYTFIFGHQACNLIRQYYENNLSDSFDVFQSNDNRFIALDSSSSPNNHVNVFVLKTNEKPIFY